MFSKYAWVVPLKDKKGVSIVNAFKKKLDSSKRKPNKTWVDQGYDQGYNNDFKKWLKDNDISMYSAYNEELRTLKNKVYKTYDSYFKKSLF